MKKISALLAATVAASSIATAQDELSVSATFAWESGYVFRGVQLADETYMPAIDVSYGNFYAGIWAALPADTKRYGNEVDFYAGYAFDVSDLMSLDLGFTYYTYPSAEDDFFDSDTNTFEIYGGLSFDMFLSPALYLYYDFDAELFTVEGSIGHSFEVAANSTVDLSVHLGWWDDSDDNIDQFYGGVGLSYVYNFTDAASLSVGANWYYGSEDLMFKGDSNKITYGFTFTAGF